MIVIRLSGGMGNQMFQYAFGKQMAQTLGTTLKIDLSLLLDRARGKDYVYRNFDLDIFQLSPQFLIAPSLIKSLYKIKSSKLSKTVRKFAQGRLKYYKEPHFHVVSELLSDPYNQTVYEGWWQSQQYFDKIEPELQQDFRFRYPRLDSAQTLFHHIENSSSICLNVRRTDFLKVSNLNTTDKTYFLRAADFLACQINNPYFFIFSDDVQWCQEELKLPYPHEVVGHEHKGFKFGNYLHLMSCCKHFIIPNSSFAWWAVWMSQNPDKLVVAPKNWFNDPAINTEDLVPSSWNRM